VTTCKDASYIDAPTNDWIEGAEMLGEEIIVGFKGPSGGSWWRISYTGDGVVPFRWDKISEVYGLYAQRGIVKYRDEFLIAVARTRLVAVDGRQVVPIDQKIPDFVMEWAPDASEYCFGFRADDQNEAYLTYTSVSATKPDKILRLNWEDESWSTRTPYDGPHVFGTWSRQSSVTWETATTIAWEDIDWAWSDSSQTQGSPLLLMGTRDGYVYQFNSGGSDNGEDIAMSVTGGRWNPYIKQGRKARLGWIDFYLVADATASFTAAVYLDANASAAVSQTIDCAASNGEAKVWRRINVGCLASAHELRLSNTATVNRPQIHAIVPFFRPEGKVI